MNKLHIIEDYGMLSVNSYVRFALSEYKGKSSFELRYWWDGHPQKNCIKFSKNSLEQLYAILKTAIYSPKSNTPIRTEVICGSTVHILNKFGSFRSYNSTYDVTYTQWDGRNKYDIRYWDKNISELPKGVRLTEEECVNFVRLLDKEFGCEHQELVSKHNSIITPIYTSIELVNSSPNTTRQNDCVYADRNINLIFKSYRDINNFFYGQGYTFKFLIENKTNTSYNISYKNIYVNELKVSSNENIEQVDGMRKTIGEIHLYNLRDNLDDCDIYSINDIKQISFKVEVKNEDTDETYISNEEVIMHL